MELLAQVQPLSASGLQIVIAGLVLLLGLAVGGAQLYNTFRRKPPIEAEFVAKTECGALRDGIGARIAKVEAAIGDAVCADEFRDLRTDVRTDIQNLRDRLENDFREVLEKLDEMKIEANTANERRASALHDRINQLGDRISRIEGGRKA